jgi:hypothetical protein
VDVGGREDANYSKLFTWNGKDKKINERQKSITEGGKEISFSF